MVSVYTVSLNLKWNLQETLRLALPLSNIPPTTYDGLRTLLMQVIRSLDYLLIASLVHKHSLSTYHVLKVRGSGVSM